MKIDLLVASYKPDKNFLEMLDVMSHQDIKINRVIVINTEQKYFDRVIYSGRFADEHKNMEIHHISKREADLGKTKNMAVKCSDADYFMFLAQDAIPVGTELTKMLLSAFEKDPKVCIAYGRQIAREDSTEAYKYIKRFFFPEDSSVRSSEDFEARGWMNNFNTNVCAMYKRSVFDELGGFGNHVIYGEDILYTAKALNAGYKIAYVSEAKVVHSGTEDILNTPGFFFDMAVSHVKHPEVFDSVRIRAQFKKMCKLTQTHLKKSGKRRECNAFVKSCSQSVKAYKKGLKFRHMPKNKILKCTINPEYWRMDEILRDRNAVDSRAGYGTSEAELTMRAQKPLKHTWDENSNS